MIANPYAKKRSSAAQQEPTIAASGKATAVAHHQPPPPLAAPAVPASSSHPSHQSRASFARPELHAPVATTFSQAFESIEDTDTYQNQVQHSTRDAAGQQERAEQRAFDQSDTAMGSTTTAAAEAQTTAPAVMSDRDHHVLLQQPHVLYVSVKQRGNGVLDYIRNVPMQFQKMVPDYIFSSTACALFLSVKYHVLYSDYIHRRIAALRTDFTLRVLLLLVDTDDNAKVLLDLNKLAVTHNLTLILAWTEEEAARYLETFKALDGRDASTIQKNKETGNFADQVTDYLTTCKGINKTDAAAVLTQFGSVRAAMAATPDELGLISGLGEVKVKRLYDAFHKPFSSKATRLRRPKRQEQDGEIAVLREKQKLPDEGNDAEAEVEFDDVD